ncbi:MAG: HNH endonuclease [Bdellovibrio sp.]|nr:MAG: HNH endonuclease [Bdellovibrio sp.]
MELFGEKKVLHIKRERQKARELRKSRWWHQKLMEGICYYCQEKFSKDKLTMDHKVPLSRGGRSTKSNVVVCCKECNNQKKYFTPVELELKKLKKNL